MARPKKLISDEQINQIETLHGYGLTINAICDFLGMTDDTLRARIKEDDRVFRALQRGRARAEATVQQVLYRRAIGALDVAADGSFRPNPREADVSAIRWLQMSRYGLSQKNEVTGANGGPIEVRETYVHMPARETLDESS